MGLSVRICTTWSCMREKEGAQQVRLGSPARKNSVASSRRVQNSAGIPGVSSPMGNNEDSASFITTCSSIPDLTTRVPVFPPPPPPLFTTLGAHARERDVFNVTASVSLLNYSARTRVGHPHPLRPLIFSQFRPTPAAYPGNAHGSVIASRGTGLGIVG